MYSQARRKSLIPDIQILLILASATILSIVFSTISLILAFYNIVIVPYYTFLLFAFQVFSRKRSFCISSRTPFCTFSTCKTFAGQQNMQKTVTGFCNLCDLFRLAFSPERCRRLFRYRFCSIQRIFHCTDNSFGTVGCS